jgi:radical SAM superfamily enzyme YgiQ (UPF0313 family)
MVKEIKRIALINPKRPLKQDNFKTFQLFERNAERLKLWFAPPLSLLTIASLTPSDIEVKIIDEHFEEIDFDEEYDLVGITAMTQQAFRAYEIADEFHRKNITVVMGGIHASVLPDEALERVNTVFIGEAEDLWQVYLEELHLGTERKIYKNDKLFDLKKSVLPRYELINFERFNNLTSYFKFLPVQATRGCPHDCSFCITTQFYGKKIRKKEIDQIINEIKYLKKYSNNTLLLFVDDNLFVDRVFAKSLLRELIPLNIKYIAQSDVKVAEDPELLRLAYLSGCMMIFIGFESINMQTLGEINVNSWKMRQLKNYPKAIKKIQENGIVVFGAFVIGFRNDNLSTFENIRNFVLQNHIPGQFTLLTPLPGSKIYDQFKAEGRLINDAFWNKCSFFDMTFKHDYMNKEDAENEIIKIHDDIFNEENTMMRNFHMVKIYKSLSQRWIVDPSPKERE